MHPMTSTAIAFRDEQHQILRAPVRDRSMALQGEKRLMLAVLERAVDDFRTYANVPTARGRWLFMEVAAWFDSSDTGPFDFEGICQATELDPDFIREGLYNGTTGRGRRTVWKGARPRRIGVCAA
jgi:hypothetical protein